MGVLRLSHAEIRVPDIEIAHAYYTEVVGLIETARTDDRVFLKAWDEHQHHSIILMAAPTYGLESVGFKVEHQEDLDLFAGRLAARGIVATRFGPGEIGLGSGEVCRFTGPSGHVIDLVHGMEQVGNGLPVHNPPPAPDRMTGIAPPRIDHIFLMCEDVDGVTSFFQEVFDFRLTEQIMADDGHQLVTFLERSHSPHDLAFITGPDGGFHHVAFWVDEWHDLRRAGDTCAYHGVPIEAGPTRHGATRGCGIYFFDPAGNRNEMYTGGYWFDPDDEPTTWTEAEMGRAIFYYAGKVDPHYMTVHT